VEEQAEATEELITQLTEAHTHQMETLIKSTTEAMKEMLSLMKGQNTQAKTPNPNSEDKQKKCEDKQNKYHDAPICKHATESIHPKQKMSAENFQRTQHHAQHPGNKRKAPEGAWGPN
jgi:hypothetical protein